jgi:hypothetical protein
MATSSKDFASGVSSAGKKSSSMSRTSYTPNRLACGRAQSGGAGESAHACLVVVKHVPWSPGS